MNIHRMLRVGFYLLLVRFYELTSVIGYFRTPLNQVKYYVVFHFRIQSGLYGSLLRSESTKKTALK